MIDASNSPLTTDLYQLTMLAGYHAQGMEDEAVFEFFVRDLPPGRNFYLAAGLEQLLDYLEHLRFGEAELAWARESGRFGDDFIDYLASLRFTGQVHALPEGTVCFPDEPLVRITAPLPQAQLIESRLINLLHFQTLIASKAVRCVLAARGRLLVDFGLRRAHGAEAGLLAARANYLAGFHGTSDVLAEPAFGIPVFGTMAHSFVEAHAHETDAFLHFAHAQPDNVVLLIDTYGTERGARRVVEIAPRLAAEGIRIKGVRIDSGDLGEHARRVRAILDEAGLSETTIFASGNLDEVRIHALLAQGAPIDGFGVGTRLDTSADAPYLDCAYKLMRYAGRPRRKRSEGKATWPDAKQVWRRFDGQGRMAGDTVTRADERAEGEPLLVEVMRDGRRLREAESLEAIRARVREQLAALPEAHRALDPAPPYPVTISPGLRELAAALDREAH